MSELKLSYLIVINLELLSICLSFGWCLKSLDFFSNKSFSLLHDRGLYRKEFYLCNFRNATCFNILLKNLNKSLTEFIC